MLLRDWRAGRSPGPCSTVPRRPSPFSAVPWGPIGGAVGIPAGSRSRGRRRPPYSRSVGHLRYDGERFEFDDRLLAHLQVVIGLKLRRSESFFLSWTPKATSGEGRHAVWIAPGVPIHFAYSGSRVPTINREWVEALALAANSSAGLVITDEVAQHPSPNLQPSAR